MNIIHQNLSDLNLLNILRRLKSSIEELPKCLCYEIIIIYDKKI